MMYAEIQLPSSVPAVLRDEVLPYINIYMVRIIFLNVFCEDCAVSPYELSSTIAQ